MMWKLRPLRRRLVDLSLQRRIAAAAAALMVAETVRRSSRDTPQAEDTQQNVSVASNSSTVAAVADDTYPAMPGLLSMVQHPVLCDPMFGLSEKYPSRLRRHQTIVKMHESAAKETLESKYKVNWRKPLGEGTFGAVFIAKDRKTGEQVAVKKISKRFTDNVSFQREMDALLHLREAGGHPNICGLRENFDEGGFYYLVLDLVNGGEMFDHLCAQGAYSEFDAARLVREVASALAFLHGIGIVHGDMKPENLMLSSENPSDAVIKVVDFGCACVSAEDSPFAGTPAAKGTANTPAYCPPEILDKQARKEIGAIDPSFDMWALGVIIYIMLTGVHPFDLYGNASDSEIEHQILSKQKPPLRNSPLTAHLSSDAIDVIGKLIEWDKASRLTAFELLSDPWVRGATARKDKMADSDKRLSTYRPFKTKLGAKVFADMVSWTQEPQQVDDVAKRMSLIERSFQKLDPDHKGYVTSDDLRKLTQEADQQYGDDDDQLSLSGFSDLLSENMKNRYFPKGHIIYHEGDIGNVMYFLNSGTIEVYTRDGFSKTLRRPGDIFGEGALMHPKKIRSASIRCLTPVHAIEISREYFEKYLASESGAKLNLREKDKSRKRQRAKALLALQKNMTETTIPRGEYVFKKGEPGTAMYILEEGKLDISVEDHTVLTLQHQGDMCGEHSLIFGRPRNVTTQCVSDTCKLHVLRAKDFFTLLDAHPSLKESVRDICLRREFQKALCVKTKKAFPRTEAQLRAAFDAADENSSGVIELDEIRHMIKQFDPTYTEKDIRDILNSLDLDESGKVSWVEFKKIFGLGDGSD